MADTKTRTSDKHCISLPVYERMLQFNDSVRSCTVDSTCDVIERVYVEDTHSYFVHVCTNSSNGHKLVLPYRVRHDIQTIVYDPYVRIFDPSCTNFVPPRISFEEYSEIKELLTTDIFRGAANFLDRNIQGIMKAVEIYCYLRDKSESLMCMSLSVYMYLLLKDCGVKVGLIRKGSNLWVQSLDNEISSVVGPHAVAAKFLRLTIVQNMFNGGELPDDFLPELSIIDGFWINQADRFYNYTAEQAARAAGSIKGIALSSRDKITATISSIAASLMGNLAKGTAALFDVFVKNFMQSQSITNVKHSITELKDTATKILFTCAKFFLMYVVFKSSNISDTLKGVIYGLLLVGVFAEIKGESFVSTLVSMFSGVFQHSNEKKITPVSILAAAMGLGLISVINKGDLTHITDLNVVTKVTKVASFLLVFGTLTREIDFADWLNIFPQSIRAWFVGDTTLDPKTSFVLLMHEVQTSYAKIQPGKRGTATAFINAYDALLAMVLHNRSSLDANHTAFTILRNYRAGYQSCMALYGHGATKRRSAFWIYLYSETAGTGKSHLTHRIAEAINQYIYQNRFTREDLIYSRCDTTYWDRYNHQPVIFIDDLATRTDDPRMLEMINICNVVPYTLDCATLDNPDIGIKGTQLDSEVVITSTNTFDPASSCVKLSNKVAWRTRRNICAIPFFVTCDQDGKEVTCTEEMFHRLYCQNDRFHLATAYQSYRATYKSNCTIEEFSERLPVMRIQYYGNSATSAPTFNMKHCLSVDEFIVKVLNEFKAHRETPLYVSGSKHKSVIKKNSSGKFVVQYDRRIKQQAHSDDDSTEGGTLFSTRITPVIEKPETGSSSLLDPPLTTEDDDDGSFYSCDDSLDMSTIWQIPLRTGESAMSRLEMYTQLVSTEEQLDDLMEQPLTSSESDVLEKEELPSLPSIAESPIESTTYSFWLTLATGVAAVLAAAYAGYKLFATITTELSETSVDLEQNSAQKERNLRKRRPLVQHSADTEKMTSAFLYSNTGSICIVDGEKEVFKGSFLGYGEYLLFPRHFLIRSQKEKIPDNTLIRVYAGTRDPIDIYLQWKNVKLFHNANGIVKDIVALRTDQFRFRAKIERFPKESELSRVLSDCNVVGFEKLVGIGNVFCYLKANNVQITSEDITFTGAHADARVHYGTQWSFNSNLKNGDCGKILYNPKNAQKFILGMYTHLFGATYHRAEPITQEMVSDLSVSQNSSFREIETLADYHTDSVVTPELGVCQYVGAAPPLRQSEKSAFIPAPLQGEFSFAKEIVKEPSILTRKDPRCPKGTSPLLNAGSKYKVALKPVIPSVHEYVKAYQLNTWTQSPQLSVKIRSCNTAIQGVDGIPEMKCLALSTAPGMSHIGRRPYGQVGKGWMFERDEFDKAILVETEAKDIFCGRLRAVLSGERIDIVWTMSLKTELLKLSKIATANTRGFSISDFDYVLLCKMFFADFAKFCTDYHRELPYAIGVDMESDSCDQMLKNATRHSRKGFDGDYAEYDGRLPGPHAMSATDNISSWYWNHIQSENPLDLFEEGFFDDYLFQYAGLSKDWLLEQIGKWGGPEKWLRRVQANLIEAGIFSYQQVHDCVLHTAGGMPSGHFLTAVLNSLVNELLTLEAAVTIAFGPNNGFLSYSSLDRIGRKYYGDDHMIFPPEELQEIITGDAFFEYFEKLGFPYTPADKSSHFGPNKDVTQMEFLKRDIVERDGRFYGVMKMATINSLLNWNTIPSISGVSIEDAYYDRMKDALKFLYFQDPAHYKEVLTKGNAYLANVGCSHRLPIAEGIYREYFDDKFEIGVMQGFCSIVQHSNDVGALGAKIFETERTPSVGATYGKPKGTKYPPIRRIESEPISYAAAAGKFYQVATYQWNTSQAKNTRIALLEAPLDLITNHQLGAGFKNMKYWRGDVEVKIIINGTKFHQGMLIAYFNPVADITEDSTFPSNTLGMTNMPHGFLEPQSNATLTFRIPYRHPLNYLSTNAEDFHDSHLGYLGIAVFSALLNSDSSSTTLPVTVAVRFVDSEFHLQRPIAFTGFDKKIRQHGGNVSKGDTVTNVTNYITGGSNTVQGEVTGDEYDVKAADFDTEMSNASTNMDYPNVGGQSMPIVVKGLPGFNSAVGVHHADRLTLYPSEIATTRLQHFGTEEDEMRVEYIAGKPTFHHSFIWDTTQGSGAQLLSALITPCMWSVNYREAPVAEGTFYDNPPALDSVASMFHFWSGTIVTHVKIVASTFATGRLIFAPMYGYFSDNMTLDNVDSQAYYLIDLAGGQREFNFEFNFASNVQQKKVTTTHKSLMTPERREKYGTGMFYCFVQAPYTVGEGVPLQAEVLVFHYMKDVQFNFYDPKGMMDASTPINDGNPALIVQHAGEESIPTSDNPEVVMDTPLLGTGSIIHAKTPVGMQPTVTLRDIAKKYHTVPMRPFTDPYTPVFVDISRIYQATALSRIANLYAFRRGQTRMMLMVSARPNNLNSITNYSVTYQPGYQFRNAVNTNNLLDPFQVNLFSASNKPFMVVENSFTTNHNFMLNPTYHSQQTGPIELFDNEIGTSVAYPEYFSEGVFQITSYGRDGGTFQAAFAGGDDFRCGAFVGYKQVLVYDQDADIVLRDDVPTE